jgi:hypothetical protein
MSYKKQQQWYITSQSEHHHTTNPRTKQTHTHTPDTTILNQVEEKIKTGRPRLRHCHQRCVTPKA